MVSLKFAFPVVCAAIIVCVLAAGGKKIKASTAVGSGYCSGKQNSSAPTLYSSVLDPLIQIPHVDDTDDTRWKKSVPTPAVVPAARDRDRVCHFTNFFSRVSVTLCF